MRRLIPLLFVLGSPVVAAESLWQDISTPPAATGGSEQDAALLVAIEHYVDPAMQQVPGAKQNIFDWQAYLTKTRKMPAASIKMLVDAPAIKETILAEATRLAGVAKNQKGRLWVVFIGHGAPSRDGQDGLLVGSDAQQTAASMEARGLRHSELEKAVSGVETVMVLDTCFSGKSSGGVALAPGLQPAIPLYALGGTSTILTAASGSEFAGPLPGGNRPAYSYLVLGALRGWGDGNGDGQVTAAEATNYALSALNATVVGRQQTPEWHGDGGMVLGKGREGGPDLSELQRMLAGGDHQIIVDPLPTVSTWTAADDQVIAAMVTAKKEEFAGPARSDQAAEIAAAKQARIQAVAAEWASLRSAFGDPTHASAAAVAAVRAKVEEWKADTVQARTRDVQLSGSVSYKDHTQVLSGSMRVEGVSVPVDHSRELSEATAWLAQVPTAPSGGSSVVSTGGDWQSPTVGRMKWIPAGSFMMGSGEGESGRQTYEKQHAVSLTHGYWMMEHEVTQGEWKAVMGSNPMETQTNWNGKACSLVGVGDNLPVACVSWDEVQVYIQKLSARDKVQYRLPTEAEWEWAARGGQTGLYAGTSAAADLCRYANLANANRKADYTRFGYDPSSWTFADCDDGYSGLSPVGSFRANGYGLYDISGNVWEWVSDWYGSYDTSGGSFKADSRIDPMGNEKGSSRVVRGGSWYNAPGYVRVAARLSNTPSYRSNTLGFRLSRSNP